MKNKFKVGQKYRVNAEGVECGSLIEIISAEEGNNYVFYKNLRYDEYWTFYVDSNFAKTLELVKEKHHHIKNKK